MSGFDWCIPRNEIGRSLFPKQNFNVMSPNFHIHVSVIDLNIPRICLPILLQPNRQTDPGNMVSHSRSLEVSHYGSLEVSQWMKELGTRLRSFILGIHQSDSWYSVRLRKNCIAPWLISSRMPAPLPPLPPTLLGGWSIRATQHCSSDEMPFDVHWSTK